jgi:ribulose-5-phosphate 4-epimerase/fuculose-1-phosphate aldolase
MDTLNEDRAREEICRVGKSLFDRGYVHATAGNISVRLADGYLITPTDACLGDLAPEQVAKVDLYGKQVSGARASKTLALHTQIYLANEQAGMAPRCVIHTHSTYCVALTLQETGPYLLPAITPYFVMKVGRVPVLPYLLPGDPQAADTVAGLIRSHAAAGTPIKAVMLGRLGPNVWHDTPAQAMAVLEELEETAKLWHLSDPKPAALSDDAIQELRDTFRASW